VYQNCEIRLFNIYVRPSIRLNLCNEQLSRKCLRIFRKFPWKICSINVYKLTAKMEYSQLYMSLCPSVYHYLHIKQLVCQRRVFIKRKFEELAITILQSLESDKTCRYFHGDTCTFMTIYN